MVKVLRFKRGQHVRLPHHQTYRGKRYTIYGSDTGYGTKRFVAHIVKTQRKRGHKAFHRRFCLILSSGRKEYVYGVYQRD